jgi:hypothetical protein
MRCRKAFKETQEEVDLVTGPVRKDEHFETCGVSRLSSGVCGKEGKQWQPKDSKNLFFYMKRV